MDLSNDLISKFVKITSNQSNNKTKEGTAYGTIVEFENKMYVKLDGSDLLTPINSTSDVKDGERVTIMIKDHNAVVTGNITSPSASSEDVRRVTQDVTALGGEIAEFETIVANKIGVDELDAEVARINDLIAGRATIEDLNATNAEILNLQAKDAEIVNLVAGKAEIDDLTATNAEIENLKAKDAEITSLVAGKANISDLTAINADITDLKAKDIETDNLMADKASIGELNAVKADINDLQADKADIVALNAVIANVETLTSDLAIIDQAVISKANITDLNAANAQIAELQANKADIADLNATNANINTLDAEVADIQTLVNGNLTSDNIASLNLTSANTTIQNAMIKDAMIDSVTASKIKSGVIDTNLVTIQSTDGSMVLTGSVQQFKDENGVTRIQIGKDTGGNFTFILYDENGTGVLIDEDGIKSSNAIADGLIVDAKVAENANIAGSKLDIASVITEVNNDNSTTIKSNKIYLDEQGQSLEVAFNSLKTQVETIQDVSIDGDLTTVMEQVQSNTTQITANTEGISTLVSENNVRKEEIQNLDGEIESVNNTLSSKYSSLEQDVSGFKTTVAETYTTKTEFNNLEIGGTNLMRYSKPYLLGGQQISNKWNSARGTASVVNDSRFDEPVYGLCMYSLPSSSNNAWMNLKNEYGLFKVTEGDQITISMKYLVGDNCRGFYYIIFTDDDKHKHTFSPLTSYPKNVLCHTSHTWVSNYTGSVYLCIYNSGIIDTSLDLSASPSVLLFTDIKIEKGNKATAWSPAPEDVQGQIDDTNTNLTTNYSTTSAMNSAIQQKANEITSSVSQTYATKQSVTDVSNNLATNYSTTSAMNSAINQKANEINQTVSDTYATKQSVTDVSNNLSTNYSTTSAMNSAINQKANEINQTVSETYATKQSVTDVSNNLTTNYSTTSAMNSAINQKANEINQTVSETYTTKSEFNNLQIGGVNLIRNSTASNNFKDWYIPPDYIDMFEVYYSNGSPRGFTADLIDNNGRFISTPSPDLAKGETYTLTFWKKNEDVSRHWIGVYYTNTSGAIKYITVFDYGESVNSDFTKYSKQFTMPSDYSSNAELRFYSYSANPMTIIDIKLEKGNKATSWSKHPNDDVTYNVNDSTNLQRYSAPYLLGDIPLSSVYKWSRGVGSVINDAVFGGTCFNLSLSSGYSNSYFESRFPGLGGINELIRFEEGVEYTISLDYSLGKYCSGFQVVFYNEDDSKSQYLNLVSKSDTSQTYKRHYTKTFVAGWSGYAYFLIYNTGVLDSTDTQVVSNLLFSSIKIEKGNKATAWSPAPKDVQGQIDATNNNLQNNYSTTSAMNSAINQKANEITSSVSETYATKQSVTDVSNNLATNYSTTSAMNSAINQKANEITSSVSQTYATKQSVTDVSNNLATNYSTTSAMNSAINQKANEINQTVSETYATKQSVTDVDNKFNSYSTTTQMNSAINQKANEITSSVSETYTTKSEFNNLQIGGTNLMRYSKPYLLNGRTDIWRGNVSWKPDSPFYGGKEDVFWNSTSATTETWVEQVTSWGPDVTQGETYTISFDYTRGSSSKGLRVQIYDQNDTSKGSIINEGTEIPANVVQHREIIWTATYTGKINLCFWNRGSITEGVNGNLLFSSIKIEKGNKATAWSPAPEDIQSQIDNTNTNLTNNYTTKSELSQTTDSITAKFTESGGYNLVRNGGFIFGMNNWSYTSAYLSRNSTLNTACGYYIDVTQPYKVEGEPIKIQNGKTYIYSARVYYTADRTMGWYTPLNYITTASSSGTTHEAGFINYVAKSHETIPSNRWVDVWVIFKCVKSGYYRPILQDTGVTSTMSFADVMIIEGDVYKPWTPHPYEVYDGVTTIDKTGIRVSQSNYSGYTQMSASGFYVNNGSENVISCTTSGLTVKGNITASSGHIGGTTTIDGNCLVAGSIGANAIAANAITGKTISGGTISGATISGNTISGGTISGATISGNTISGGSISGATISGNTISGGTISGTTISGTTFTSTGTDGNSNQYQTMTLNSGALMLTGAIVGGTNDGQEANRTYLTSMGLVVKDSSYNGFGGNANVLYTNTGIYWNSKATGGEEYPNWQQLIGYYDDYVLIDRLPLRMPKEIYTSGVATSYSNIYLGPSPTGEAKVVAYDSEWGVANADMNFRPIRASAFYRKDGKHAYINATGGGTLTDGNSTLVSNGMRTDLTDFYLGVAGRVRVTDKNGYNSGNAITYKPIMASAFENGSDLMFKKNIRTTDDLDVIDILNKVEVYRYDMIGGNENEIGLIAQGCPSDLISGTPYDMDIQTANEITDEDRQSLVDPDNGGASVNLYHMASILWKVCKEQQKRIERLEKSMKGEE